MNLITYTKEFRYNIRLAFPVIIGMLGHTVVQLIDNIMVGQLGPTELAAVSLGNSFVFIAMSLGIGFSTAITPLISESFGAKNHTKVRQVYVHGLFLCISFGFLLSGLILMSQPLLLQMGQPVDVVKLAKPYLFWVGISLIPLVGFQGFRQFAEGLFQTRLAMYATIVGNVINVILNYLLIFGLLGFPQMGVEGAAIGTLISRFIMLFFIGYIINRNKLFKRYNRNPFRVKLSLRIFKKIIGLGFPSALQMFFEVTFFTSAIWMSGLLGENAQAANQIAFNLSSMTYMVAIGVGVTAMVRIGNEKGKGDFFNLRRLAISNFLLIFLLDFFFCLLFILAHDFLPWIYFDSSDSVNSKDVLEVITLAADLILIAAFFQIADGVQAVVLSTLRGMQDVWLPAFLIFLAYGTIGFPISYYLALNTYWEINGIWIGLLTGLSVSALFLIARFHYITKKLITQ
ncbi:MAG: MATE family efflux transporter [Flavobacteriaceae bacterium]|nr:MATE family efflux transporter [Flavobacteriaceae bacterium]